MAMFFCFFFLNINPSHQIPKEVEQFKKIECISMRDYNADIPCRDAIPGEREASKVDRNRQGTKKRNAVTFVFAPSDESQVNFPD